MAEYPTFLEGPPSEPLWQLPMQPGRPREVTIFCAEELRPAACVVADALVVRGYAVMLESGANARVALQLSLLAEGRGLRVLCVPRALDRKTHRKIMDGLDVALRRDLLVVPLETPRSVIEAIEARSGVKRARPRRRFTKAYLAHPTIAESTGRDVKRYAGYGLIGAAATAAVAMVVAIAAPSSGASDLVVASAPVAAEEAERPSLLLDDAVFGNVSPDEVDLEDEPPSRRWRRRAKEVSRLRAQLAAEAPLEPEEVIVIEDDEDPPRATRVREAAPLETAAPVPAPKMDAPDTFGHGAPGLPAPARTLPVDPFASP